MAEEKKNNQLITRVILGVIGLAMVGWLYTQFRTSGHANANAHAIQEGQTTYQQFCAGCHDATNLQLATQPPKLDGLFRKATLPSGAPATDDEVRKAIVDGKGIMPPFQQTIGGDDLSALIQYLHTK